MGEWLLELSFGPVQGFIEAARKSRDLYAGSYLLSEVVRAAALKLKELGAELVYPAPERLNGNTPEDFSNLSNILLVRLNRVDETGVKEAAALAGAAGRNKLAEMAKEAFETYAKAGVRLDRPRFDRQITDILESFAAWAEIRDGNYRQAYENLKMVLAARKNTRNFLQTPPGGEGIPKSSLDGKWETVLPEKADLNPRQLRQFDLSPGEQLDAIGAVKRQVGTARSFTPLSRLAAQDWLAALPDAARNELGTLYKALLRDHYATNVYGDAFKQFPYDAGLVFAETLDGCLKAAKDENDESARDHLEQLQKCLQPLWREYGRPCPYVVMMMADGDRMGVFVDQAKEADQHTEISRAISNFAAEAPKIAAKNGGQAIYAGGEDLLLVLPLNGAIAAARELALVFKEKIQPVARILQVKAADIPTLRCGVSIVHIQEPFSLIRQYAKEAESFAKGEAGTSTQGNALGLDLRIRAGHRISVRLGFDDDRSFAALQQWRIAYSEGKLPARLAYDTGEITRRIEAGELPPTVADAEFSLLLLRSRQSGGAGKVSTELAGDLKKRLEVLRASEDKGDVAGLRRLSHELILARWFSARKEAEVSAR